MQLKMFIVLTQSLTPDQQPLGFFLLLLFLHSEHHCFVDSVSWTLRISLPLSPSSFASHALSPYNPPAQLIHITVGSNFVKRPCMMVPSNPASLPSSISSSESSKRLYFPFRAWR